MENEGVEKTIIYIIRIKKKLKKRGRFDLKQSIKEKL